MTTYRPRKTDVVEDGESVSIPVMMADSAMRGHVIADNAPYVPPVARTTLADVAEMGAMPATTPKEYDAEIRPISQAIRSIASRKDATEIMHQIEVAHTRIKTRLEGEMQMAASGMFGPGGEAETRESQQGARDVMAWLEAVHQTLQGATRGLRDQMARDAQDRALGARAAAYAEYRDHLHNAHRATK